MTFIINGKDQPRVVFNYREPGNATRDRALTLTEERPFDVSPQPTAEFFRNLTGCQVLRNPVGFTETVNDDSGCESIIYWGYSIMHDIQLRIVFLSSAPAWFTLDLYPVLSVTKVSPCFADILFPSEVCLGCLDFLAPANLI
jgi:hypothetical protein